MGAAAVSEYLGWHRPHLSTPDSEHLQPAEKKITQSDEFIAAQLEGASAPTPDDVARASHRGHQPA